MNKKETEIYEFIEKYLSENGFSPSVREIGEGVGLSSSASVHYYISLMIDKGVLTQRDNKPRTLRTVPLNI